MTIGSSLALLASCGARAARTCFTAQLAAQSACTASMRSKAHAMFAPVEGDAITSLLTLVKDGEAPSEIDLFIARIVVAACIVAITAIVARMVTKGIERLLGRVGTNVPTTIFVNIARVLVWCTGAAIVLSTCFNIDPTGIVAALGVGGIAISLGMQDTIANIIGGLQLSTMGTLKKGDHVIIGSTEGVVEDVAWRETTILGFAGERTIVPNKVINSNSLTVLPPARKVKVPIQVPIETLAAFRRKGVSADALGARVARAITDKLRASAPEGMGLDLQKDAGVQFQSLVDLTASATAIVWIAEEQEFDRPAVQSAMAAAAADVLAIDAAAADVPTAAADASAADVPAAIVDVPAIDAAADMSAPAADVPAAAAGLPTQSRG